ncbi:hypothetical protein MBM_10002 [Drepanopeziza brunnea f. sp. 'multigermtubi' MB_m1]|uniref:Uncharacterized protein n=1 Tax=Marssonina brunnea f. sp. multigermtubi (strain MB_m1) TaxID=1072389 RepID=K1WTA8_MARBU|nr:uncharacterized protein MBM_10002 [Drepanopeziza brunnea f. sp. 'multigermtubi' MB_m1]EKD11833.1 hypothetical protein MBM_10002 [Drepanopeziza brunnea f. sp. 'multigermtubi' MB_m1]
MRRSNSTSFEMVLAPLRRASLLNATSNGTAEQDGIPYDSAYPRFQVGHMVYIIVALGGIITTNACWAVRITSMKDSYALIKLSATHFIVLHTYLIGSLFCVSTCVLYFGHGIYDAHSCQAAIIIGLLFYLGQKYSLYVFLVERHILVFLGFGLIGITALVFRIATFNSTIGTCQIGIPRTITSVFLGWDVSINIFLTTVFLRRCKPYMVKGMKTTFVYPALRSLVTKLTFCNVDTFKERETVAISQGALVGVIRKAFVRDNGSHFEILLYYAEREQAWFFFTFGTLDGMLTSEPLGYTTSEMTGVRDVTTRKLTHNSTVTWATVVIHWLTTAPERKSKKKLKVVAEVAVATSRRTGHTTNHPPRVIHAQTVGVPGPREKDTLQLPHHVPSALI